MRSITDDEWALSRPRRRRLTLSARCAWSYRLPSDLVECAVRKVDAIAWSRRAWRDSRLRAFEEHAASLEDWLGARRAQGAVGASPCEVRVDRSDWSALYAESLYSARARLRLAGKWLRASEVRWRTTRVGLIRSALGSAIERQARRTRASCARARRHTVQMARGAWLMDLALHSWCGAQSARRKAAVLLRRRAVAAGEPSPLMELARSAVARREAMVLLRQCAVAAGEPPPLVKLARYAVSAARGGRPASGVTEQSAACL